MRPPHLKYFGERSLSSWTSRILQVGWYIVLILFLALTAFLVIGLFDINLGDPLTAKVVKTAMGETDPEWVELRKMPAAARLLVFPYLSAVTTLLLLIMKKAQRLFTNFQNNIIFSRDNAMTTSGTSKLLIGFSVLTFNFTTLLVSVILIMICEIFKNGTILKEEQDLTV
jgi:hypothetical protein